MHQACLLSEAVEDAKSFGWQIPDGKTHDWNAMVDNVQNHISSLNFKYRTELRQRGVEYLNARACFVDDHTVELTDKKGNVTRKTAEHFVIATGGRPKYLGIPNEKECCITSDDLFSLQKPPGKTLVVGASYVALECAGFLVGLGYDTTVMMRSIPLRGFDQECAERICTYMMQHGVNFIRGCIPSAMERLPSGRVKVSWAPSGGGESTESDEYDTVLLAIGRYALTEECQVAKAGVEVNPSSKKIIGTGRGIGGTEQSNVSHIYAIGDVLHGYPELTPVAVRAGILLAQRLFGGKTAQMDYVNVPTAVFTPLEYGSAGLCEEDAIAKYGEENIEVYLSAYKALELALPGRGDGAGFAKVICLKTDRERLLGMHYLGWNAGEIIQGFAIALKLGGTKADLDNLVGIHPTVAEVFTGMTITRSSGEPLEAGGC